MNIVEVCNRDNVWASTLAIGLLGGTYLVHRYFRNHTSDKTELLSGKILKIEAHPNILNRFAFAKTNKNGFHVDTCVYVEESNQIQMVDFPLSTDRNKNNISFHCRNLEILLKIDDHLHPVCLPEIMNYNLLRFLQIGRIEPEFCCFDFVNFLFGNFKQTNLIDENDWTAEHYFADAYLKPGDVILLHSSPSEDAPSCWSQRKMSEKRHMAIYLGHGIYISLFGKCSIMLTSMQEMQKVYDAAHVLKLSPAFDLGKNEDQGDFCSH